MNDLRLALRSLRKRPLFAAVAIVTLALSIGATTTLFTIVNAVLLRPLSYPDAGRIVSISERQDGHDQQVARVRDYYAWRHASAVAALAMYGGTSRVVSLGESPDRMGGQSVAASFFSVFEARPALGRTFRQDEDVDGGPDVVVLSDSLWRRLGADPSIVGRTIRLDDRPVAVLGVMPRGFQAPRNAWFWVPIQMDSTPDNGSTYYVQIVGRLRAGVSIAAARSEVAGILAHMPVEPVAKGAPLESPRSPVLMTLHDRLYGEMRPALLMLLGAVAFLLLIACANVANLLLARGAARQREFAVRVALGASRWRLARQLLWESVVVSVAGGALGLLVPLWTLDFFLRIGPASMSRVGDIHVNGTVLAFTAALSILTGVAFGLIPAVATTGRNTYRALKEGGVRSTGTTTQRRIRRALVVTELTIALVVLTGAGLLTRSFERAVSVDVGFQPAHALELELYLTSKAFPTESLATRFFDRTAEEIAALPGVTSVGYADAAGIDGYHATIRSFRPGTQTTGPPIALEHVSAGFMKAFGSKLVAGRLIDARDQAGSERVAVVSEAAAEALYSGKPAIGKTVFIGDRRGNATIVGIAENLQLPGSTQPRLPQIYAPITQASTSPYVVAVRYSGNAAPLLAAIRHMIAGYDPLQLGASVAPMQDQLDQFVAPRRFNSVVIDAFAALALVLAAVGLYGVMAYQVAQRTQELGIRMALGADRRRVLGFVLREGMGLALLGTVCGIALSLALSRFLAGMLFGVTPHDLPTFAGVSATLIAVALAACYLPARRATRVDPMVALRYE
ncbi:MAG: ABC transporter permease [Gemmatimonadaceae bacterium]|nr:ABC transporter permease [Gemmatimonadaceae bacterium]